VREGVGGSGVVRSGDAAGTGEPGSLACVGVARPTTTSKVGWSGSPPSALATPDLVVTGL
jgi:hypothetical protein